MDFHIADTFTESIAKLIGEEQKVVQTTAFNLQKYNVIELPAVTRKRFVVVKQKTKSREYRNPEGSHGLDPSFIHDGYIIHAAMPFFN